MPYTVLQMGRNEICWAIYEVRSPYYIASFGLYLTFSIWVVGVLGNLLNIVIFSRQQCGRSKINALFWWLAVSDLLGLFAFALCKWYYQITGPFLRYFEVGREFASQLYLGCFFLLEIFHTINIELNVVLAFRRYRAATHPLQNKTSIENHSVRKTVLIVYVLGVVLYLPYLFEWSIYVARKAWAIRTLYFLNFESYNSLAVTPVFALYDALLRMVPAAVLTIISFK